MITKESIQSDLIRRKIRIGNEYYEGHTHFPEDNIQEGDLEKGIKSEHTFTKDATGNYALREKRPYKMEPV